MGIGKDLVKKALVFGVSTLPVFSSCNIAKDVINENSNLISYRALPNVSEERNLSVETSEYYFRAKVEPMGTHNYTTLEVHDQSGDYFFRDVDGDGVWDNVNGKNSLNSSERKVARDYWKKALEKLDK